ncbi:HNH endonuclease [Psychrobacillus sp. FSL K6-1415]|uniref:HNH endonuclease n=1 Tax=Psychrobacillus sp. FSL K6-1415 TaxID=2921544 RepID=UPI0030F705FC
MSEKSCSICKETKPIELFEKEKRKKDGRGARCLPCKNIRKGNDKAYRAFSRFKEKANKYPTPIETTKEEVAQIFELFEGRCAYCYVEETAETGTHHLEHVIPLIKGGRHHKSNLVIACDKCNRVKGDRTLTEFFNMHEPFTFSCLEFVVKYIARFTGLSEEEVQRTML